ncbi:MAG: hypothetical protein ACOCXX_02710 [Planctomycetota bacterium]
MPYVLLAEFQWSVTYLVVAILLTVGMAALSFKTVFTDWRGFLGCVGYWIKPDWLSAVQGEYFEDLGAEMRLGFWIIASLATGVLGYYLLYRIFG